MRGAAAARHTGAPRFLLPPTLLCLGLAAAIALRVAVAGSAGPASAPAGALFGAALLAVAWAGGWRPTRPRLRTVAIGAGGGLVLLAVPVALHVAAPRPWLLGSPTSTFPLWFSVVTLVAVAEEALLRGALMSTLLRRTSPELAVAIAALAFALLHVPLYGWVALPLDLAAGVWLGGLRLAGGGAGAPAIAHALADWATWWLR